ncbi:MAG: hypothetical protein ACTSXO_00950 [Candidatus Heimdallarchaeota archaeon]
MSMNFQFYSESLKYLKEHQGLVSKLYLPVFDQTAVIKKESQECIEILEEIQKLISYNKILVENLYPIIEELKLLQKNLYEVLPGLTSFNVTFNLLMDISRLLQNLVQPCKYIQDYVSYALIGRSETIDESDFTFSYFYYFNEKNFLGLVESLYQMLKLFENQGVALSGNKVVNPLITDLQEALNVTLFLSERLMPNTLFYEIPVIFTECDNIGKRIQKHLELIRFSFLLVKLHKTIETAIVGLQELTEKYKHKQKKKINLDSFFRSYEGTEELKMLLKKTRRFLIQ